MPFNPQDPHLSVALIISGAFGQFSDPLDWIAKSFGLDVKVDRQMLSESLPLRGGGLSRAVANALGNDKQTRFRLEIAGRGNGQLVATCSITVNPSRMPLSDIERNAIDIVVLNRTGVLGVQATLGDKSGRFLEGIKNENALLRLMPLNVFNRAFFQPKIDQMQKDKKLKLTDVGDAVAVHLVKPWLFYDLPASKLKSKIRQKLLPS